MKTIRFCVLCLSVFVCSSVCHAQEIYSKVKIKRTGARGEMGRLAGLLRLDHFDFDADGSVVAEISESDLLRLKAGAYAYEILIPNTVDYLDSVNKIYYQSLDKKGGADKNKIAFKDDNSTLSATIAQPAAFQVKSTFGGYYSFAEMEAAMNSLVTSYPTIVSKTSLGKTYENRDIWVIKISDNVAADDLNEPEVLYMGLQHPREAITGASMIFFMQYLAENYTADTRIKALVDNREIFIIPCFNPDGYEYNRTTATGTLNKPGGNWRKNRFKTGTSTWGVDLNRNWGEDWANCGAPIQGDPTACGSADKTEDTYWGAAAFSEKETQAVRDFTKRQHLVAAFDQHAFGPYYSLPFGRQVLHNMSQKGRDFFTAIPALMGTYNGMRAADSYDALGYEVAGGFKDWMLMGELGSSLGTGRKDSVWAMTGEGGAGGGTAGTAMTGMGNFWAPSGQIVNLCRGMCFQNLQLAYAAGSYVDIEDANDVAISSTTGNLQFRVKRLGLGNDPVQVTLIPMENIAVTAGTVTINSMPTYYEEQKHSIAYQLPPGMTNGLRIKYAWRVQTGGYTYTQTVTKIYNPLTLVNDNMEGATVTTNWAVSSGWAYSTDAAFAGAKSLTESPGGDYARNVTLTATYKNVVDLSSNTAAYLTFWTKHRAENFRDRLQVQVSINSTNGTDGTWTAIPGLSTIKETGTLDGATINGVPALTGIQDFWKQEVYDLSGYTSNNFRFRLAFLSDNSNTTFKYEQDDGFYIDNLKLVKTTTSLVVLPVQFIAFEGKLLPNNTVQLQWQAVADGMHDYYEVERSADGVHFSAIGKGDYFFIDRQPVQGTNYYRIKQWDKDGKFLYSKVLSVAVQAVVDIHVYPNPADAVLYVAIGPVASRRIHIMVSDMHGKAVVSTTASIAANGALHPINIAHLPPQLYVVKVAAGNGEVLAIKKFTKR